MLSKLSAAMALVGTASAEENWSSMIGLRGTRKEILESVRSAHRPNVRAGDCADGGYAVNILKEGPFNINEALYNHKTDAKVYQDEQWDGIDVLFKKGYPSSQQETTWQSNFDSAWDYTRFSKAVGFETATLFKDDTATYTEPRQGGAGTCYIIQALSAVAEYPKYITDLFVTGTDMSGPDAGIIGINFYVRGKPWTVAVDDRLFFGTQNNQKVLAFNQADDTGKIMWAAIMEKAWAKMKGNYEASEGGMIVSGLRGLTGAPTFIYEIKDLYASTPSMTSAQTFDLINAANDAAYVMSAATGGGDDTGRNSCGIATGHAYAILAAFKMTDANSVEHKMILLRNPWGTTDFSGTWKHDDPNWTDALVAQVPYNIDPRTSKDKGIFTMDLATFVQNNDACISNYAVAHLRDTDGYKDTWFDKENGEDGTNFFYVTAPAVDGALYFTVETYYQNVVPLECSTGQIQSGQNMITLNSPVVNWNVKKNGDANYVAYHYTSDQFSKPILITTYSAGDVFKIEVTYTWFDSPAKDYTVKVYSKQDLKVLDSDGNQNMIHMDGQEPSGFTKSTYRGMVANWDPSMLVKEEPKTEPKKDDEEEPVYANILDVFDAVKQQGGFFPWDLMIFCFSVAPEICFNPFNWI